MHPPQRFGDARVSKSAQQARGRSFPLGCPQGFDQQHLDEARQHEVAAGSLLACLLAEEAHQRGKPLISVDVNHGRQE